MLFTLIAHLFIIKLRRMLTAATNSPGPVPVIASPVSADEYRNAIIQAKNSQPVNNPNIRAYPEEPQQVLTIGLIKILIEPFMAKVGQAFERINYLLQSAAASFCSHTKKKMAAVIGMAT
ncbi:MAG: hypothetical protein LBP22_14290 [Deltaproteobacteria bacterium]|jgi:hypothetical protein|nr:hypothetical protein [Deltaproteobacteria bacterium]